MTRSAAVVGVLQGRRWMVAKLRHRCHGGEVARTAAHSLYLDSPLRLVAPRGWSEMITGSALVGNAHERSCPILGLLRQPLPSTDVGLLTLFQVSKAGHDCEHQAPVWRSAARLAKMCSPVDANQEPEDQPYDMFSMSTCALQRLCSVTECSQCTLSLPEPKRADSDK